METNPKSTSLFLAVSGEEKGLFGSKFYNTENPFFPIVQNYHESKY